MLETHRGASKKIFLKNGDLIKNWGQSQRTAKKDYFAPTHTTLRGLDKPTSKGKEKRERERKCNDPKFST